jgi:hypothetical protein
MVIYCQVIQNIIDANQVLRLNQTIDQKTASTTYNASAIGVIYGTLDAGNVVSIQVINDFDWYNVSEAAGTNPLLVQINFTGIVDFGNILMKERYAGGQGLLAWNL